MFEQAFKNVEWAITQYLRIRPKYYNKISIFIIGTGLLMTAPSILVVILDKIFSRYLDLGILDENGWKIGLILVVLGIFYNILMFYIDKKHPGIIINKQVQDTIIASLEKTNSSTGKIGGNIDLENRFQCIIGNLPWVVNIGSLHLSNSSHKQYMVAYKNYQDVKKTFTVTLFETNFDTLVIPNFGDTKNDIAEIDSGIIVWWQNKSIWTLNSFSDFEVNGNCLSIEFKKAFANNLLLIFGDVLYETPDFTLVTKYIPRLIKEQITHPQYGTVKSSSVIVGNSECTLEILEMSVIDALIDMKETENEKTEEELTVFEKPNQKTLFFVSSQIESHLRFMNIELNQRNAEVSRVYMTELMKKVKAKRLYLIPRNQSKLKKALYRNCFGPNIGKLFVDD